MQIPDLVKQFTPLGNPQTVLRGSGEWESGGMAAGVIGPLVFGATIPVDLSGSTVKTLDLTTNAAFQFLNPALVGPTAVLVPRLVIFRIRNVSGGAHGAGTFDTLYRVAGNVSATANNNGRSIVFLWTGALMVEVVRGAADIPN